MPAKNTLKIYVPNGFYHVYNRGVEKRSIFVDEQDYRTFLYFLKIYLLPRHLQIKTIRNRVDIGSEEKERKVFEISQLHNFYGKIELLCFVLMPNHFHLEIRQKNSEDMRNFMKSLVTKYAKYFNRKYQRVGPLFQARYKAILIRGEKYLLHLSRYIHLNPKEVIDKNQPLSSYIWSSYLTYLEKQSLGWVTKNHISNYFDHSYRKILGGYQEFVEGEEESEGEKEIYKEFTTD